MVHYLCEFLVLTKGNKLKKIIKTKTGILIGSAYIAPPIKTTPDEDRIQKSLLGIKTIDPCKIIDFAVICAMLFIVIAVAITLI